MLAVHCVSTIVRLQLVGVKFYPTTNF
jgi:hypothetical protein